MLYLNFFRFGTGIGEFPSLVLGTTFFFFDLQAPGNLDQQDC